MRSSTLSFPALLTFVLLTACDPPSKAAPRPASTPAEVGMHTAEAEAKVLPPRAVPIEVKDVVGEPSGAVEPAISPAPAAPPTGAVATPAGAAAAVEAPPAAPPKERSAPEASTARKAVEGRPAKVFTDCRDSEAFADGRCYASREAACEALSCAGKCIHTRSMPPQVVCG